ncbi:MAG: rhomboid family intramembrane serine protease [Bacteroidetes bacterium]|nr:rhomboid family intramembrane serine protease [Bacteroidota bacterium]
MYDEEEDIFGGEKEEIDPETEANKVKFRISLIISSVFLCVLWAVKIFETYTKKDLSFLGVYPKEVKGLIGILTAPLVHADFSHLTSNSITLFVVMIFLFYAYINSSLKVFAIIYFLPNVFVWFLGRPAYHIGASGIIYGILAFLFFVGLLRRDPRSIGLSLLVTFMYGGLVWGILPYDPAISFEAHISGAAVGILCAVLFRNSDPKPPKYEWEEEEEGDN